MTSIGIDYGLGQTNIDKKTGIHYGCISQHLVTQVWADSCQADYGEPHCPKCGNEVCEVKTTAEGDINEDENIGEYREHGNADYLCETCNHTLDSEDVFGDEPQGWYVDDGEYKAVDCLDSDILIIESPYFTYAQFCSPCVPGAGNLDHPIQEGVKTFAFGHDWFESNKAPYPVYRVDTGEKVPPPED
jgi:hypothetical protein